MIIDILVMMIITTMTIIEGATRPVCAPGCPNPGWLAEVSRTN